MLEIVKSGFVFDSFTVLWVVSKLQAAGPGEVAGIKYWTHEVREFAKLELHAFGRQFIWQKRF